MGLTSGLGRFYAFSERQVAAAGFTPSSPTTDGSEILYFRRSQHTGHGSAADASISGPYTRAEVEEILREEVAGRIG